MLELSCGPLSADIEPDVGGRLVSLRVRGQEIVPDCDERDPDFLRGCFPLAPWCGVLPGGPFQASGTNPMHGLVHSSPWDVKSTSKVGAVLEASIGPGTARPWLGRGTLRLEYRLSVDALEITLAITAVEGSWPAAVGFHPWFRRHIDGVVGEARYSYLPSARLVLEGDFPRKATADPGEYPHDDVFVGLSRPPEISWPNGMRVRIESDAAVWVVYERHPHGFCIEPWSDVDGPLEGHRQPPLAQGRTRSLSMRLVVADDGALSLRPGS